VSWLQRRAPARASAERGGIDIVGRLTISEGVNASMLGSAAERDAPVA
jgi:hypothetical protein